MQTQTQAHTHTYDALVLNAHASRALCVVVESVYGRFGRWFERQVSMDTGDSTNVGDGISSRRFRVHVYVKV